MQRYFVELAYNGGKFAGWQRQKDVISIQQVVEENFSKVLRQDIAIVGCGRTDAGVHARQYFMHFDGPENLTEENLVGLYRIQPTEIAIKSIKKAPSEAHARYDANLREYQYHILKEENPFQRAFKWYNRGVLKNMDKGLLDEVANLYANQKSFFPFCKAGSDVDNFDCKMYYVNWKETDEEYIFTVAANRFLRGMVRLLIGASIKVCEGQLTLHAIEEAFEKQQRIDGAYSVPGHALYLTKVEYPFSI